MSSNDLTEIFELFGEGVIVGGLASGIFWLVGYAVEVLTRWFLRS